MQTSTQNIRAAFLANRPKWADLPKDRLTEMADKNRTTTKKRR